LSLALVVAAIAWLNPRAISYFGFTLMLNLAIPIALATMAQMFVIAGNDLDLSIAHSSASSAAWRRPGCTTHHG
jgi:ribose transport system permease protein